MQGPFENSAAIFDAMACSSVDHLLKKHGMVVMAHRGGDWSVDNSMENFRAALANNVEGIETDIWLSKDGVPMITHGGDDGQLALYGFPNDYVYDWTMKELQTNLKIENGEPMPTLLQTLELFRNSSVFVNIELKGPLTPERKPFYDFNLAARTVYQLVLDLGMEKQVMVSSFTKEIIDAMKICLQDKHEFMLCTLLNRKNLSAGTLEAYLPP